MQRTIPIRAYLFFFTLLGLALCPAAVYSGNDDEEAAPQFHEQHEEAANIWEVITDGQDPALVKRTYMDIERLLLSNPEMKSFMRSHVGVHPRGQNPWLFSCSELSVRPYRLHIFAAVMGIDLALLRQRRHLAVGRTRMHSGEFREEAVFNGPMTAFEVLAVLMRSDRDHFNWFQIGTALLISGELQQNLHVDPALVRFHERYGHLSQQLEATGNIRLQELRERIEYVNKVALDSYQERARISWSPVFHEGCAGLTAISVIIAVCLFLSTLGETEF